MDREASVRERRTRREGDKTVKESSLQSTNNGKESSPWREKWIEQKRERERGRRPHSNDIIGERTPPYCR